MTSIRLEPFFLDSSAGRTFALLRAPANASRCILFVPAFAEEMNKSRAQVSRTAEALVRSGYAVLVVDLYGTGDSEGEFGDATWDRWKLDIDASMDWIERNGFILKSIVAARLGCALAAECLRDSARQVRQTVFWQPVETGAQFMTQFLRLRVAASMMVPCKAETVDGLKQRIEGGERVAVAGYALSPDMWRGIQSVNLSDSITASLGALQIIEIGRSRDGELSAAGRRIVECAQARGVSAGGLRIPGEPFWNATEIVVNDALVRLTIKHIDTSAAQ